MAIVGELSLREQPIGGDVAAAVKVSGAPIEGRREVTLLIHGYNNSQTEAEAGFDSFSTHLNQISPATNFGFYGCLWPGDTHLKIISALSYPFQISPAKDSAQRFAEFLRALSGPEGTPMLVRLVGHSLGCRVVLELLKRFASLGQPTQVEFRSASLMAAAVPVGRAKNEGEFGAVIQSLKSEVLFSTEDKVLQLAFPIGETAAFDGFFPEAVGRHGHPEVWSTPAERMHYSHGDYWSGTESAQAVATFMGAPVHAMPQENAIPNHEMPSPATIPERALPAAGSLSVAPSFG